MSVIQIVSGAQTGADRAGLDAGLALGLRVGGWVPRDRRTDEGPLSDEQMLRYNLREHGNLGYTGRTLQNVLDSYGTVLFGNVSSPGTRLTIKYCEQHRKPYYVVGLHTTPDDILLHQWLVGIRVMNVAGNRERTNPGIYASTYRFLTEALGGK